MDRRVNALAASPTRTAMPDFPAPMSAVVKSSPVSPDAQKHLPLVPSADECRPGADTAFGQHDQHINAYILSLPTNNVDHGGYQYASFTPGVQDDFADQIDQPMTDADPPQPPRSGLHRLNTFFRRGTVMSTSTDVTTASLREALSGYSSGFVTQVKRVLRSTMPLQSARGTSPIAEVYPEADCPMRDSWVHDEHAPDEIICAPPLPGEFLIVDRILEQEPSCPGGLEYAHRTMNCLCRPTEAAGQSIWVSGTGLSERAAYLVQPGIATFTDFNEVDVFGNSLMHVLAARDADHRYVLDLVAGDVPCSARNTAGQTFLHLLDPSWLSNDGTPLLRLLQAFRSEPVFLLARDCYGRTLFHALRSKIDDPAPLARVLRAFNVRLSRDAFGVVPSFEVEVQAKPLRRALTSVTNGDAARGAAAPPICPSLPRYDSALRTQQRLLAFVSECNDHPTLENSDGRNGLHALAATILSDTSVYLKVHGAGPQRSRKRKLDAPDCKKKLDSSEERLHLREQLLGGLLDAGVDPNAYDEYGNTPLMAFCAQVPDDDDYKVPVSILQLLLSRGADLHARNRRGETALHVAVRRGRRLAVRTLVNAGANVHVRDASGRSVLDVCDDGMAMGQGEEVGYMRLEACRAWLSGPGSAVQDPSVLEEWAAGGQ